MGKSGSTDVFTTADGVELVLKPRGHFATAYYTAFTTMMRDAAPISRTELLQKCRAAMPSATNEELQAAADDAAGVEDERKSREVMATVLADQMMTYKLAALAIDGEDKNFEWCMDNLIAGDAQKIAERAMELSGMDLYVGGAARLLALGMTQDAQAAAQRKGQKQKHATHPATKHGNSKRK